MAVLPAQETLLATERLTLRVASSAEEVPVTELWIEAGVAKGLLSRPGVSQAVDMLHENLGYAKWLPQPVPRAEDIKGRRWADGRVECGVVKVHPALATERCTMERERGRHNCMLLCNQGTNAGRRKKL